MHQLSKLFISLEILLMW